MIFSIPGTRAAGGLERFILQKISGINTEILLIIN